MWSIFWAWAIATGGTSMLSLLITSFADGIYEKNGYTKEKPSRYSYSSSPSKMSPIPETGWVVFNSLVLGAVGFAGLLYYWDWLQYMPLSLPLFEMLKVGLTAPLEIVGTTLVTGAASYGAIKLFVGATRYMKNLGANFSGTLSKITKWRDTRRNAAATKLQQQQAKEQEARNAQQNEIRQKQANINRLCATLQQAKKQGPVFDALAAISVSIAQVLAVIQEDGNKQTVLPTLLSDYMTPAEQCLQLYERLTKREIGSAKESLQDIEEKVLPLMSAKFSILYDQIHVNDIAALATAASSFEVARNISVRLPAEATAELKQ